MFNLDPPPEFQGLRPDKPVEVYQRHLPHWRQEGATYFLTFRLADSLPRSKLNELESMRRELEHRHPSPRNRSDSEEIAKRLFQQIERWLDRGMGRCHLRDPAASQMLADAFHNFNGERYELGAYIIMPNHAHLIACPFNHKAWSLEKIVASWKKWSSRKINVHVGRAGNLWQEESYDRIIRDEEHLWRCLQYIGDNGRRAGLAVDAVPRWVRPDWKELGWDFVS